MFLHVSVILSTGRGCLGPGPGGRLGGSGWWGPGPGQGGVSKLALRQTTPPPQQTATAADGTHPTGMHSCLFSIYWLSLLNIS